LTWPAGLKTLPYGANERLPSGKLAGILTYFQAKVNTKFLCCGGFRQHRAICRFQDFQFVKLEH
jgi:hypothetical protein